jgi:SAM-dependent methyltransferase
VSAVAIWHDIECGAYTADLPLWEELSSQADGAVLDLGCGTGRVSTHLARRGFTMIGLDVDPDLIAALAERAEGLPLQPLLADARGFELDTGIALALAPMQLVQLLSGAADRRACLDCIAAHLLPGGRIALAIVERLPEPDGDAPPLPDVREVEGWVYSSLPVDSAESDGEIAIRRLRQTVSPAGALSEEKNEIRIRTLSAEQLEREGEEVGLVALGRHTIPPTDLHVGSTVVVLGRAD